MEREPNYGRHQEPGDESSGETRGIPRQNAGGEMGPQDERTWSMLSHLSVLAGLIGLMPLGALIIWLVYKDRSPRVGFHALQALWYQVAWIVIIIAYSVLSVVLMIVLIGFIMIFLVPILALIPIIHGCYAAYQVNQGIDYRYPFIADKIDGGQRAA
ncbi:MAG: DUF4870 domain-containing protein [Rubrobacteraceae bacterium]